VGLWRALVRSSQRHAGTFAATAAFGWEAILTQVNTSSTTFEVDDQWTVGADLWVTYCSPSCSSPQIEANLTDRAIEEVQAVTNFTTGATVTEGGKAVAAVGVLNASSHLSANVAENSSMHGSALGAAAHPPTRSLLVKVVESAGVAFAPALGIVPADPAEGQSWTSASNYSGTGSWNASFAFNAMTMAGRMVTLNSTVSGTVPVSGPVWLNGSATGPVALSGEGSVTSVLVGLAGPFTLLDGGIFVPAAAELLHSSSSNTPSSQPWSTDRIGNQTVNLLDLDYRPASGTHLGLVASAMSYASTGTSPSVASFIPAVVSVSSSPDDTGSAVVQGEPQSVAAAQAGTSCLEQGIDCGSASSGLSAQLVQAIVVVGVVVGLVALISVAMVERRRKLPPPRHPNSSQYPPGSARPPETPSGGRAVPGTPAPPAEPPDPLDHLW
jgi:hypothetical protein